MCLKHHKLALCFLELASQDHTRTILTGKVLDGHILNGDLFQEVWSLTSRVACHDALLAKPLPQPGQVTVTAEWIGQQVPGGGVESREGVSCEARDTQRAEPPQTWGQKGQKWPTETEQQSLPTQK